MYDLVNRHDKYQTLEEESKERLMHMKTKEEQYVEKTEHILTCLALTKSTLLISLRLGRMVQRQQLVEARQRKRTDGFASILLMIANLMFVRQTCIMKKYTEYTTTSLKLMARQMK